MRSATSYRIGTLVLRAWERVSVGRGLGRDLTIIIALKIVALMSIKLTWFSVPSALTTQQVSSQLLAPVSISTQRQDKNNDVPE
jgi:hypothetical protein